MNMNNYKKIMSKISILSNNIQVYLKNNQHFL